MYHLEINLKIRQLICQKGYTVYRLSKESFIPLSTLYGIMNNKGHPSIHTLILLCKFLNISMDEFLLESDTEKQTVLSASEEKHIMLYRSISPQLQIHIDQYIQLLSQNKLEIH